MVKYGKCRKFGQSMKVAGGCPVMRSGVCVIACGGEWLSYALRVVLRAARRR